MTDRTLHIRWQTPDGGADHCVLKETDAAITLEGVGIPGPADQPALRYRIVVDPDWAAIRSLHLTIVGGPTFALRHDGYGGWTDGEGKARKDLEGVTDIHWPDSPVLTQVSLRRLPAGAAKSLKRSAARIDLGAMTATPATLVLAPGDGTRSWAITVNEATDVAVLDEDGGLARLGDGIRRMVAADRPPAP